METFVYGHVLRLAQSRSSPKIPRTEFNQLQTVRQGTLSDLHVDRMPTALDFSTSLLQNLREDLDDWAITQEAGLCDIFGGDLDLTASFMCRYCSRMAGGSLRMFDVYEHICPERRWSLSNFARDEMAIGHIERLLKICDLNKDDTMKRLGDFVGKLRCELCPSLQLADTAVMVCLFHLGLML